MKSISFSCLGLMLSAAFLLGCNGRGSDKVREAKDSNAAMINSQIAKEPTTASAAIPSKSDADFLVDAASGAMMEVELGQIAQTNSANPRVQAFGLMMVKDDGEGIQKIKQLAARSKITLPDAVSVPQQKEINALKKRKAADFDRIYLRLMVNGHQGNIRMFEKEAGKGIDSLTRVFASSSLQMLRRHRDSASVLADALGINNSPDVNGEAFPH